MVRRQGSRPTKTLWIFCEGSTEKSYFDKLRFEERIQRLKVNILGIKHYLARINRPQTNGKAERFFRTYKTEYATGIFNGIKDFITHYNEQRLHMSLNYKTPKQTWNELINAKQFRDAK